MATETLRELNDTFGRQKAALKSILDKGDGITSEDIASAEAIKNDLGNLRNRIDEFRKADAFKADLDGFDRYQSDPERNVPFDGSAPQQPGDPFKVTGSYESGGAWFETRNGVRECVYEDGEGVYGPKAWKAITSPEYKTAFTKILRAAGQTRKVPLKYMKTLEEGLDDQGGYTVPIDSMINRVIERKPTPTRLKGMVDSVNTSREFLEMLKLNYATDNIYTTGFRVTKTGEQASGATAAQVTDTNLFGTIKIPVHTFMIRGLVTLNMIEDAALNITEWMSGKFSQTIEILYDDKILNGTGKQEPSGILNRIASAGAGQGTDDPAVSYVATGDAATVTPDGLINLAMDVPEQYEDDCKFVFNKVNTFKALRAIKDLNDRYLFGTGVQDSGLATPYRPTDLIGYPYVFSGLMPNIAANAYPILFGDLKGYQFVNRIGFSVKILDQPYAELGQVALVGRVRFGGQVVEPWRLRVAKVATS